MAGHHSLVNIWETLLGQIYKECIATTNSTMNSASLTVTIYLFLRSDSQKVKHTHNILQLSELCQNDTPFTWRAQTWVKPDFVFEKINLCLPPLLWDLG